MSTGFRLVLVLVCGLGAASCSSGGKSPAGVGGNAACLTGFETCACYANHTCEAGLTCTSNNVCAQDRSGAGGEPAGGTGGTLGAGTGGNFLSNVGGNTGAGTGGTVVCQTGFETCACYGNHTCEAGLTCASNICVNLSAGTGGMIAGTGTGGMIAGTGTGGMIAGTGTGGMIAGAGTGGMIATPGTGGMIATPGTGGGGGSCSCTSPMECTTDGKCVDPKIIDDFADCNAAVNLIRGRTGGWYGAADTGIYDQFGVSAPPTGFTDTRCGAWIEATPVGLATTYGLIGVSMTSTGAPVDLRGYTGLSGTLEAYNGLDLTIKTTGGGYFTKRLATSISGSRTFNVAFSQLAARADSTLGLALDLSQVTDVQFTVYDPSTDFDFVVHGLTLY